MGLPLIVACNSDHQHKSASPQKAELILPATVDGKLNITNSEGDDENSELHFGYLVGANEYDVEISGSVLRDAQWTDQDYPKRRVRAQLGSKQDERQNYVITSLEKR